MEFSLAYIKSNNQFLLRDFNTESTPDKGKLIDRSNFTEHNISGIIYEKELNDNNQLLDSLAEENKFVPVRSNHDFDLSYEQFESLDFNNAENILGKIHDTWLLQNNIQLIENLFGTIEHLNNLWPNDRTSFFEELWFILKSNLGTKHLNIIYNDLQALENESHKPQLIRVKVEGNRLPEPIPGGEIEDKIMQHYEHEFGPPFEIKEYNSDEGELVAVASVKKSPLLIMAKIFPLSRLQEAVIHALFEGLS